MKPTQEQVIAWARDSGMELYGLGKDRAKFVYYLEAFAALAYDAGQESMKWDGIHSCHPDCQRPACVHTRKAVEAEREACAKVVELECIGFRNDDEQLSRIADAIRARRE